MLPNLKLLRAEYGVSQQKLADAIGVSQPSINKYENHNIEPEIEILVRMADFFDTSVDYLVGHTAIRRRIEPTEAFCLNSYESRLITRVRNLDEEERECVDKIVATFLRNKAN